MISDLDSRAGLLLVGHGTRSRVGTDEFLKLVGVVAQRAGPTPVEPALLELAQPTIGQGLSRLVERGARRVVVVPLLLFAAGHAKRDIPAALSAAAKSLDIPSLEISQADHLGCEASILELSRLRFTQMLQDRPQVPAYRTCLLLVGRGSRDQSATAEMQDFARLRAEQSPIGRCEVAFLAMAQPAVQDILPALAAQSWQRIVVQPHLLFHGELFDTLRNRVRTIAACQPQQEWLVTPYLGEGVGHGGATDELLARAIFVRARSAAIRVVAPGEGG